MVARSRLTNRVERLAKELAAEVSAVPGADRRLAKAVFARAFVAELRAIDGDAERALLRVLCRRDGRGVPFTRL